MDSVEVLIDELAKGDLLPPAIYTVGGGCALPDLRQRLEDFPWTERLPFSRKPIIETIQPGMVTSIADPNIYRKNAKTLRQMRLHTKLSRLQKEDNVFRGQPSAGSQTLNVSFNWPLTH